MREHNKDEERVEPQHRYHRQGDMSSDKELNVWVEKDGDIVLYITKGNLPMDDASVEFCAVSGGGGNSFNIRKALTNLMFAIKKDNEETPLPEIRGCAERKALHDTEQWKEYFWNLMERWSEGKHGLTKKQANLIILDIINLIETYEGKLILPEGVE